mmetsp:Transcript_6884/g.11221  ORF Transcript_6884/g.11221 Transcript_6884/m.11221 type:complete len:147 (+) Transcript_6884:54-494(+)
MFGLLSRRMATSAATAPCRCTMMSPIIAPQFQHLLPSHGHASFTPPQITVRHATKKAGGSTSNGRDSAGRRLGIKVWHGTPAKAGGIIVRQRGKKFLKGENTGMGNDHTVFAKVAGVVQLERSAKNRKRIIVNVVPELLREHSAVQ